MVNPSKDTLYPLQNQAIVTNGALQFLFINHPEGSTEPVKIYAEQLDIFLVLDGSLTIRAYNKREKLTAGDIFVMTRSSYSEIVCQQGSAACIRLRFLKDKVEKLDYPEIRHRFCASILKSDLLWQKIFHHSMGYIPLLEAGGDKILNNQAEKLDLFNREIFSIFQTMIEKNHPALDEIPHSIKKDDMVYDIVDILEKNVRSDLKMTDIMAKFDVSKSYFSRYFKKRIGVVPNIFWRTMKVHNALTLLSDGLESLSDISFMLGFNDQSHFNNVFKKYMNTTPGKIAN